MKKIYRFASVFCMVAMAMLALTACEGGDLYDVNSPDWIKEKIDSIENANKPKEEVLTGMQEDVYTIGATDFSTGFWQQFSKYYVIPDGKKWNAQFNLNINPSDNTYYKNFALIVTNDVDRGGTGYQEYGAFRYDATGDSATYNSQWGTYLYFKYTNSSLLLSPVDNKDEKVQQLGGKVTLTVDRSKVDTFLIKITNGTVTKTYTQPYKLPNLNADATNTNIRCFLVPEGSYINFLSTNIVPIGGLTSANDKAPVSMVLNNVPDEVELGTSLDSAMANVSATVTFEEGVTKEIPASELYFTAVPNMDEVGEKNLVVIYNKTFKGENASTPITASATFKVVRQIQSIEVTSKPTRNRYYFYTSKATEGVDRTLAFDPTGLEVTGTYADGSKAVIDNAKLTFSAIPAKAGTQVVTISSSNGKTAEVRVKVEESSLHYVAMTPSLLGAEDNTQDWWSAFTQDVQVPAGQTFYTTFTNYAGADNWNNFVVILRNAALGEYGVVRADNYGWGNGYAACSHNGTQGDWKTWLAAMNGSKVTVYVTNCNNGTCDVQAVMVGNDNNIYTQYYCGINTVNPDDFQFAFTVDHSHCVFDATAPAAKRHHARRR